MMLAEEDAFEAKPVDLLPVGDARVEDRCGTSGATFSLGPPGACKNSKIQDLIMRSLCEDCCAPCEVPADFHGAARVCAPSKAGATSAMKRAISSLTCICGFRP